MTSTAPEICDVICRATVTTGSENVRRHLLALAKATLGLRGEFSAVYHLTAEKPDVLPAGLALYDRGPLSDPGYLKAAARVKIIVDLADGTDAATRTARLSALKEVNARLLAEDDAAARSCLPADALFTTPEALIDRVYVLLGRGAAPKTGI
jgi:hypothetical protein